MSRPVELDPDLISEEERQQYKEAFDMFDDDNSGFITVNEIYRVMRNNGYEMPMEEIKAMVADLDDDNSGHITFDEFMKFMKKVKADDNSPLSEEDEVLRAFQTFDKDKSGYISCLEFRHILCNLGDKLTSEEVDEIFKEADLNHDGKLEYKEFIDFWKNK
jgi:calmodulin